MTDAALPEGLQPLLDRQQIEDVLTRYSRAVDRADIDLLKTCYHDDATEDHAGVFTGTARDYVDQIAGILPRAGIMNHMVMNVLVEFADANAALVEAYILTFARMKKDGEVRLCFEWNHEMPMLENWGRGLMVADPTSLVRGAKRPHDILYRD